MALPWDSEDSKAAATNRSAVPTLDEERLADICGGDTEFEASLIGEFRSSVQVWMLELADSVRAGDVRSIRTRAHAIKGSSATLGGMKLAELCHRLEQCAAEGRSADVVMLFEPIPAERLALDQALSAYLVSRGGGDATP